MKDKIKEILSELELENVDNIVDKITKEIALLTVPKNKYNDLSDRLKNVQEEKTTIETELEELKSQNLSDEDKRKKEQEDFDKKTKELSIQLNKVKAKEIFKEAKISDEKIEELLQKVVSEDEKNTLDLANSFAEILKTKVDDTKKQTETDLLENTPKPNVKTQPNGSKTYTKEDFLKMSYSEKKNLLNTDREQYNQLLSEISMGE